METGREEAGPPAHGSESSPRLPSPRVAQQLCHPRTLAGGTSQAAQPRPPAQHARNGRAGPGERLRLHLGAGARSRSSPARAPARAPGQTKPGLRPPRSEAPLPWTNYPLILKDSSLLSNKAKKPISSLLEGDFSCSNKRTSNN